jgi:hypothetical protein
MRPDTYQVFENISVENITGKCGSVIEMKPWKQFFDMEGSTEKPFGIVRNINISNINVKCNAFGEIQGNSLDKVSDIKFENIQVTAQEPALKTKYSVIKTQNVFVNSSSLVVK